MKFSKLIADRYAEEIDLDFSKIQETETLSQFYQEEVSESFLTSQYQKNS